jgi:carbonic anhydrase
MIQPSHASCHCSYSTDRRQLLRSLGLGGALISLNAIPFARALAAGGTDALLLNCIDYRLTGATTNFMTRQHMAGKYDQVVLAGAALGAKNDKFPDWSKTFWDHVQVALDLHHIHKIVIVDHRDCGAYNVILGKDLASNPKEEFEVHATQMRSLRTDIAAKYPSLQVEMFLMALNGSAETVT